MFYLMLLYCAFHIVKFMFFFFFGGGGGVFRIDLVSDKLGFHNLVE